MMINWSLALGEDNIASIREAWKQERELEKKAFLDGNSTFNKVYTMVQSNSSSEVKVTERSMDICVEALLR